MEQLLKLVALRPSRRPDVPQAKLEDGTTVSVKIEADGTRKNYLVADLRQAHNPLGQVRSRTLFIDKLDLAAAKAAIGSTMPGSFAQIQTAPYEVNGRVVNTRTIVLLAGESLEAAKAKYGIASPVGVAPQIATTAPAVEAL